MNDERTKELETEIERLRGELSTMQHTLDAMTSMMVRRLEKEILSQRRLSGRLELLEHTVNHTDRVVRDMIGSRIWKGLAAAGGMMLRVGQKGDKANANAVLTSTEKLEKIQMRCDSFNAKTIEPVAGRIEITGWAVASDGIERIDIQVGEFSDLVVRYGGSRPDIGALFPRIKNSAKSGFVAGFDTKQLPDGVYRLKVRATTRKRESRELDLPFVVNQEAGELREYGRWLKVFEERDPDLIRIQLSRLKYRPLVSILVPVYKTNPDILLQTIESVKEQSYVQWELILVDDCSQMPEVSEILKEEAGADTRIRFAVRAERGGISAASNDALAMSVGEYIALLDHDDLLAKDALFHMVNELQKDAPPDLLYSDEDHIDESGLRFSPFFKPDWSPDLILSENYVTHLMMFRRNLAMAAGGFRTEFDLSQDHDILLRMSTKATKIVHVPKVLYHWRTSLQSMSRASTAEEKAFSSSRGVVENFVKGRGTVEPGLYPGRWRVRYPVPKGSTVSILIPTAGKLEILDRNLKAFWKTAGYDDYEIVIIDNSRGESVVKFVDELKGKGRPVRRFDQRHLPFNYSRINNLAAATCDSKLFLFLNDDTEGIAEGWLLAMVELAMRPEVGAVGAKLLYPNGMIQHAGVSMGLAEICGHSFKGLEGKERHYYDFPDLIRNVSAVTAACVMVRADVFREVGGFDEEMFPVAYNDIDLTLKIGAAGYRVLYTPHALLYHHEAFSKSVDELNPNTTETVTLKTKWKKVIERDPFYNPNLTRHIENWSLRWD